MIDSRRDPPDVKEICVIDSKKVLRLLSMFRFSFKTRSNRGAFALQRALGDAIHTFFR